MLWMAVVRVGRDLDPRDDAFLFVNDVGSRWSRGWGRNGYVR